VPGSTEGSKKYKYFQDEEKYMRHQKHLSGFKKSFVKVNDKICHFKRSTNCAD
jgi:hypothetical protein